jgi:hypothetical protein
MVAEKRTEHRHTLALDAEVHFCERPLEGMFRCRTQNIGLGGAFLPADHMPLGRAADVELVLHASTRPDPKRYHIQARVVRTVDNGAGLCFSALDSRELKRFRRFLLEAKVAARQSGG